MKRVGIREFRDHATRYLAAGEVLAIERHGRPIGFYVPTASSKREALAQALEQLQRTVEQVLTETGLDEDGLSRLYDLHQPLPPRSQRPRPEEAAETHAAGR